MIALKMNLIYLTSEDKHLVFSSLALWLSSIFGAHKFTASCIRYYFCFGIVRFLYILMWIYNLNSKPKKLLLKLCFFNTIIHIFMQVF
jgi:hypothetical protein